MKLLKKLGFEFIGSVTFAVLYFVGLRWYAAGLLESADGTQNIGNTLRLAVLGTLGIPLSVLAGLVCWFIASKWK